MVEFNRNKPLFERTNVPCELLFSSCSSSLDLNNRNNYGLNNSITGNNNNTNNISFFTLRILEGKRTLKSNNNNSNGNGSCNVFIEERVIRFEISDECCHITNSNNNINNTKNMNDSLSSCQKNNYSIRKQKPILENNSNIQGHGYGHGHGHSVGPPIMMQQNRIIQEQHQKEEDDAVKQENTTTTTNNNNNISLPIRIYELEVGESDFDNLRRDQALLVDFTDFAQSFISLLSYCDLGISSSNQNENRGCYSTPKSSSSCNNNFINQNNPPFTPRSSSCMPQAPFKCRIEEVIKSNNNISSGGGGYHVSKLQNNNEKSNAKFSIVESNQFRELTHLSLTLKCGTDSTMKNYLSTRLRQTIVSNKVLKHELEQQILRAKHAETSCQRSLQQYNDLSLQSESEKHELKIVTGEKYQHDKCRLESEYKKILQEKEKHMTKLTQEYEHRLKLHDTKYQTLENKYSNLQQEHNTKCNEKDKLQNELSHKENILQNLTTDIKEIKNQYAHA